MRITRLALLDGVAGADEVSDLKAKFAVLDARLAAMDQAPPVPQGFKLRTVSEGRLEETRRVAPLRAGAPPMPAGLHPRPLRL